MVPAHLPSPLYIHAVVLFPCCLVFSSRGSISLTSILHSRESMAGQLLPLGGGEPWLSLSQRVSVSRPPSVVLSMFSGSQVSAQSTRISSDGDVHRLCTRGSATDPGSDLVSIHAGRGILHGNAFGKLSRPARRRGSPRPHRTLGCGGSNISRMTICKLTQV